eukprot:scaffold22384_cov21-Tisochrysis_lutea.AAC.2
MLRLHGDDVLHLGARSTGAHVVRSLHIDMHLKAQVRHLVHDLRLPLCDKCLSSMARHWVFLTRHLVSDRGFGCTTELCQNRQMLAATSRCPYGHQAKCS